VQGNLLVESQMNIYVGNLSYNATEDDVRQAFEAFGTVTRVNLITDRMTGKPRGFGFVEMANDDEARAALDALHGADLNGRALTVNEARPRPERGGGGRRGGSGGGGGYRSGGGGGRDRESW
jgi:RNA recognition motif-containing protein